MELNHISEYDIFIFKCNIEDSLIPTGANFKYDKDLSWWYTINYEDANKLYKYADKKTKKILDEYRSKENSVLEQSWSTHSDFDIPVPKNSNLNYLPFQKAGIEYAYHHKNTLLADEMGTGKTIQSIGLINKLYSENNLKQCIIICPATMKDVWFEELKKWFIGDIDEVSVNSNGDVTIKNIMIMNYKMFSTIINKKSKKFRDPEKGQYNPTFSLFKNILKKIKKIDLLILDESHKIINYQSNTTRNIFKLKKKTNKSLFLTGTPIFKNPEEAWTTIKFFGFEQQFNGDKAKFMEYYSDAEFCWRTKRLKTGKPKNLRELQTKMRTMFMIRRKSKDVLKDLPDKIRKIVPIEINKSVLERFDSMRLESFDLNNLNENGSDSKDIIMGAKMNNIEDYSEFRQVCGLEKSVFGIHYAKELLETTDKIIIFVHHKSVANKYINAFPDAAVITGNTKREDKINQIKRFQEDPKCRQFIGNLQAASVGITLTAAHHVIFAELDTIPAIMEQAEARAQRLGQINTVYSHLLVAKSTLDAYIANQLIQRMEIFNKTINKKSL